MSGAYPHAGLGYDGWMRFLMHIQMQNIQALTFRVANPEIRVVNSAVNQCFCRAYRCPF